MGHAQLSPRFQIPTREGDSKHLPRMPPITSSDSPARPASAMTARTSVTTRITPFGYSSPRTGPRNLPYTAGGRLPEHAMRCGVGELYATEMHHMAIEQRQFRRSVSSMHAELARLRDENAALRAENHAMRDENAKFKARQSSKVAGLIESMGRSSLGLSRARGGSVAWAERGRAAANAEAEQAAAARLRADADSAAATRALAEAEAELARMEARLSSQGAAAEAAVAAARAEAQRRGAAKAAAERLAFVARMEADRAENERVAAEKAAAERAEREAERAKLEGERAAAEADAAAAATRANTAQAEHDRVAAEKVQVEAQAVSDLAAAAEAAEVAAYRAFADAWKAAPANRRGKLSIRVERATVKKGSAFSKGGIDFSNMGDTMDPYAVVQFGTTEAQRTETLRKTTEPAWNATIDVGECTVAEVLFSSVVLTVKDDNTSEGTRSSMMKSIGLGDGDDEELGVTRVCMQELERTREHTYTKPLGQLAGESADEGEVTFTAAFEPLPHDDRALRAAYEATGRMVPAQLDN